MTLGPSLSVVCVCKYCYYLQNMRCIDAHCVGSCGIYLITGLVKFVCLCLKDTGPEKKKIHTLLVVV